jgi:hypothetical protein
VNPRERKQQENGENFTVMSFIIWTRWVGYVAHMGKMSNAYNILIGENLKGDLIVYGRIILKGMSKK